MKPIVSLTFDDGLPSQIENALPVLKDFGAHATFFLICNSPYSNTFDVGAWRGAVAEGHEIGSHSVNHKKAAELDKAEAEIEARESRDRLRLLVEAPVASFCYPYTDCPEHLRDAVARNYGQARGGRQSRKDLIVTQGDGCDMYNVPAFHVGPSTLDHLPYYFDALLWRRGWLTLMFHGVGKDGDWDNIETKDFETILQRIKMRDIDIVTFAEGAAWYRSNQ